MGFRCCGSGKFFIRRYRVRNCTVWVGVCPPSIIPRLPHDKGHCFASVFRPLPSNIGRNGVHKRFAMLTTVVSLVILEIIFICCVGKCADHVHGFV